MALAVGPRHDPVGRKSAIPAAIAVSGCEFCTRRKPVLGTLCVLRHAADRRSAIADFLAAIFAARRHQSRTHRYAADVTLYALLLVSAAAMFVWLADKGWHYAAALLSAIAFAFGAAMAWRIQHVGQVMSLAYLPITLLLSGSRPGTQIQSAMALRLVLAAALLVLGRDQIALLSVYFLIAYVIAGWLTALDARTAVRRSIAPLTAATIAGIAIIACPSS